jgi:tetratricopeptide (TPR) repeat protein
LQAAEGLAPDKNQLADLQYWQALVDLRDPESDRGQLAEALGSAEQFMASGRAKAGSAEEIAKAMVALGAEASPRVDLALLTKALVPLRAACDQFKYGDVPKRFGELLVQATRLRIAEAEPATPEELTQLEDDLRHTAGAEVQSAVAKAWMAESRIRQGQGVEDAEELLRNIEAQIPADDPYAAYGAYVRALVYNSLDPPRWDDALEALDGAVGSPLVDQQGRMATAAGMVLKAMARQKEWADKKAIDRYLVESPFLSPDEAERYFRLLSKVEKTVVAGGDAAEAEKAQAMQARTLEVGLMLAALFRPEPALEPAWSCASRLAQLSDAELASDALPVLASCVRTHLRRLEPGAVTADDQKIAIVACTRIARLLEDDKVAPDDASVANVYDPILKPIAGIVDLYAEGIAQGKPQAVDPAVLEDFYGALGKLIWTRQSVRWPFASTPEDVAKETARLLDGAISLHDLRPDADEVEKVAEYHLKCGHAELAMLERDLDSAQAHADQVLKLTPGNNGANGLLSGIFLWRSREQLTRVDRLENLVRSIEWGEQAVQNAPPDEPLLVTWLIGLGTAYVERANFTRDVSFQTQKDDLNRAIDYGEQAAKLENANPDYPYLIQGNAYEDLAWLVRDDVEANVVDNYEKAIEKFWAAADTNTYRRAQALCCLGRCYYKIVADSNLDPSTWRVRDLDRLSAEETLKKAAQHLQDAILEDPAMADAFYFLGLVQRQLGDPAEADKNFEIAKNIAIQKKLSAADVYAQQWVAMGAAFADPRETAPDLVKKRVESLAGEAGPMGEALRASAQVALVQSLLQRAKDSQEPLGDCDEVLRLVDAALGKDLSDANSEHVALILARTECRVRKGLIEGRTKVWNWDDAKATLTDADWAVKLAYTRGFLSDSFLFRAMIRGLIGSHILNSPDQATNGPPPPWQEPGADISQIDQGIDDLREAIRLEPGLEARRAADLRSQGIALVFHKKKKEKSLLAQGRQLTPDERERYLADLENAIRWAEEWLQIPSIKPDERTSCEQLRRQFEDERNSVSNPSPK